MKSAPSPVPDPSPRRASRLALVGAALALAASSMLVTGAHAAVTGVDPGGATVQPGEGVSATVTVSSRGEGPTCLSVESPSEVSASLSQPRCGDDGSWSSQLSVGTTARTRPGTYAIRVVERDKAGSQTGSGTFTLTVEDPSTTTTARPTTTAPTTTARPTTTEAPPATVEPSTTSAPATTVAPSGSVSLAEVARRPLPDEVLFLPLPGESRRRCVPLERPCGDPDFELVIVPAVGRRLAWVPTTAEASSVEETASVAAVGVDPGTDPTATFLVPALDARPAGGRLELLARTAGPGSAVLVSTEATTETSDGASGGGVRLTAELRPAVAPPAEPLLASTLFGTPSRVGSDELEDARPAVALFGPEPQVVAGILADPGWRLDSTWLPLLKATSIAHLARHPDGRVGLALPTNATPITTQSVAIVREDPASTRPWGLLLFGVGALVAGSGVIYKSRRR